MQDRPCCWEFKGCHHYRIMRAPMSITYTGFDRRTFELYRAVHMTSVKLRDRSSCSLSSLLCPSQVHCKLSERNSRGNIALAIVCTHNSA